MLIKKQGGKSKICIHCDKRYFDLNYNKNRKFCSHICYVNSKWFREMIIQNGKNCLGRKCLWGNKIAKAKFGKPRFDMRGDKHWNWKGGLGNVRHKYMQTLEYKNWRRKVFERDDYTCVICGDKNGFGKTIALVAHHKAYWGKYPELRYDVSNGMTVCREDHILGHQLLG